MDLNIPPSRDDPNITEQEARRASLSMANKFPEMENNVKQGVAVPPTMQPMNPLTTDPTTELTEEDIFQMKRLVGTPSEAADQSAVSIADSTSNFAGGEDEMGEEDGAMNGMSKEVEASLSDEGFPASHNCIICGDYVFGRNRPKNSQLNKETVTELTFPFEPLIIPGTACACKIQYV